MEWIAGYSGRYMGALTHMKLFNKLLRVFGVSTEVKALVVALSTTRTLRSTQGSLATAFSRHETAHLLIDVAQRFKDTPQSLLGRAIGNIIIRRIDDLYATTKAYLRSDSLYEAAAAECKHELRNYCSDLHYKVVVGKEWNPIRLALIARYHVGGADPFQGKTVNLRVRFGYDDDDYRYADRPGYFVNALILAPEWACAKLLTSQSIKHTESFKAVDTCVDTVVAFWQKDMFSADQDCTEARTAIKHARLLDTPRPAKQKVA